MLTTIPMNAATIRAPVPSDLAAMLALNNAHEKELGALNAEQLERLVGISFHTRIGDRADGFIIALEQGADYASPNYRWFSERFVRFAYIDRVVVGASARKSGLGRKFYEDVVNAALTAGHGILACEVNSDPPNPVSDAFHAALGFEEIGRARIVERGKTVRYLVRTLREN
jgi:predicted GNAT superfamily acetyltransferase